MIFYVSLAQKLLGSVKVEVGFRLLLLLRRDYYYYYILVGILRNGVAAGLFSLCLPYFQGLSGSDEGRF